MKRHPLKEPANNIEVTQDAVPLIFVNDKDGTTHVLDAKTMEEKRKIEKTGQGIIMVADIGTPATASPGPASPGDATPTGGAGSAETSTTTGSGDH